jgi:tyrosine-protein kinase Etk/Wzc
MRDDANEVFFTLKDLKRQFIRRKKLYFKWAVSCFAIVFFCKIIQEPSYSADAVFKQADQRQDHSELIRSFLKNMGGFSHDSSAQSVMQSRILLRQVVEEMGLQAKVGTNFVGKFFSHIKNNLYSELGFKVKNREDFVFHHIQYEGNKPLLFYIRFLDESFYEVLNSKKQVVAKGMKGQQMTTLDCSFMLKSIPETMRKGRLYSVRISPWLQIVKKVSSYLKIKTSKHDKRVLLLSFENPKQNVAADFLNHLMSAYQRYLKRENEEIAQAQLEYLEQRQQELSARYEKALEEHVDYLSRSLGENGFISLKQEMEILEKPKEDYLSKLFDVELELSRLKFIPEKNSAKKRKRQVSNVEKKNSRKLDDSEATRDVQKIEKKPKSNVRENEELSDLLPYEKQYVAFERKQAGLELDKGRIERIIKTSSKRLEEIFEQKKLIRQILDYAEGKNRDLPSIHTIPSDQPALISCLKEIEQDKARFVGMEPSQQNEVDLRIADKKDFLRSLASAALGQLQEQQKQLQLSQEKLTNNSTDLQGISPEAAQKLYVDYNNQLDSIHVDMHQLIYLQDQVLDPDFELTSLSSILTDSVSQDMIHRASQLALELRDNANHSYKDQERLKEALATQKKFLKIHVAQTIEMYKLRARLIEEKISSLQDAFLRLLETEKELIEDRLSAMQERMKALPVQWKKENELMLKRDLSVGMIEGLTHLAESKSIDYRLFNVESKPIDYAVLPYQPTPSYAFVLSLLSAFLAASLIYVKDIFSWISRGTPISPESLRLFQVHSCGSFSQDENVLFEEMGDSDRETLRKLSHFVVSNKKKEEGIAVALIGEVQPVFSYNLARLLGMRGLTVLVIECSGGLLTAAEQAEGLLQYLNGELSQPPVHKLHGYDYIPAGRYMPYAVELLSKKQFSELVHQYKKSYDCILLSSRALPETSGAYAQLQQADALMIYAGSNETLSDLKEYIRWQKQKEKNCLTVVFREARL